jgi:hypothetical protein
MLRSLTLRNVGPATTMEFVPGKRLNVITGDNGLGKSFLLDLAWWAVTRSWAGPAIRPPLEAKGDASVDIRFDAMTKMAKQKVVYDRPSQRWRFPKGKPAEPGLVVYARVDGDFAVWDSNRRFGDFEENESGIPKSLVFTRENVWDGLKLDGRPICNGLVADWTTWVQTESWEADALAEALERLSPTENMPVRSGLPARVDVNDSRLIPTLRTPYGQDVPITLASAGMKRILALAYLLVWAWREHLEVSRIAGRYTAERMLIIIDEVEAHLHPKWQRVILSAIVETLNRLTTEQRLPQENFKAPKLQFIVATHSPLVLTSLEPIFKEGLDGLFELQLDGQYVTLRETEFRRLGGAENWLVSEAFGLKTSRSLPGEKIVEEASDLLRREARPSESELNAMAERLRKVLPDIDPFWTRWRVVTERGQTAGKESSTA